MFTKRELLILASALDKYEGLCPTAKSKQEKQIQNKSLVAAKRLSKRFATLFAEKPSQL